MQRVACTAQSTRLLRSGRGRLPVPLPQLYVLPKATCHPWSLSVIGRAKMADFIPSEHFSGPRLGYAFKLGTSGLGFYADGTGTDRFQPANCFAGARPGFVFKSGTQGLGYYSDGIAAANPPTAAAPAPRALPTAAAPAAAAAAARPSFVSAAVFAGAQPGYAYKLGSQGLGYYPDGAETAGQGYHLQVSGMLPPAAAVAPVPSAQAAQRAPDGAAAAVVGTRCCVPWKRACCAQM